MTVNESKVVLVIARLASALWDISNGATISLVGGESAYKMDYGDIRERARNALGLEGVDPFSLPIAVERLTEEAGIENYFSEVRGGLNGQQGQIVVLPGHADEAL